MDNLPSNIEIETAFKDYCKGCNVCDLEVEEMELGNFMNASTQYILHCRHDEACERVMKCKTKKEKNQTQTDGNQMVTVNTAEGKTIVRKTVKRRRCDLKGFVWSFYMNGLI